MWCSTPEGLREDGFWSEMRPLIYRFIDYFGTTKTPLDSAFGADRMNPEAGVWRPEYDDVMPTYCDGFKSYLGYYLMTNGPLKVQSFFRARFPRPDEVDCEYLTEVLAEIGIDVEKGFGFDPGQRDGLDAYLPPEPGTTSSIDAARRWLTKAQAKAAHLPPIVYTPMVDMPPTNQTQPKATRKMDRPNTILGRSELAEKEYQNTRAQFKTRDFLKWWLPIVNQDGTEGEHSYDELIPPYCHRYATALGFTFSCIDTAAVPVVLDKHFRNPDKLDLDYLHDVLAKIEDVIGCNYSFSTSAGDGIDYYNGFENESQMMDADRRGVDTSNKHEWRVKGNVERSRKWMTRVEETLQKVVAPQPQPEPVAPAPATVALPALTWSGSVADLAETLYRLARAGFIDLAAHWPPGGNRTALCRHVCQLFQVPVTARTGVVKSLNAYLGKFTAEQVAPGPLDEAVLSAAIGRKPNSKSTVLLADTLGGLGSDADPAPG